MDKSATFKDFYLHNYGSVFRFVRGMLHAEEGAEDIVQESFFRLLKAWPGIEADDHARGWVFTVARNLSVDRLKSRKHESDKLLETYASEDFFLEQLALQEAVRLLEQAIEKLPAQTGRVVALAYAGKSNQEIVELMGLSINSVKTLKKEGYKKLRAMLGEQYLFLLAVLLVN